MKQPLQSTPSRVRPAQAEVLYDVSVAPGQPDAASGPFRKAPSVWPGEDWDDEAETPPAALERDLPRSRTSLASAA